ncbi:hypothetical protein C2I06_05080 [Niallia circulans]|jgi:hypothetical protein|uniref:Uncharacterized protein n=1 Tax=Niallia circulans TaxID=1397 RepID=A0A268FIP4_NIACI|nr:hypothetical protein [Niallia circulans]AYV66292.1 hypothetical protein C2I06_05080 [Niallia circulans]AYV70890.1 hypothetical protein C2H98_04500 [Niallia circulans]PAD85240.1 hypothetical protein CHH57_00785 [Niallia circulans]
MFTIREMNRSDIASIRKIAVVTWKNTYSEIILEEIQAKVLNDAYSDVEMEKRLNSSLTLVAENNDKITGYAFFQESTLSLMVYKGNPNLSFYEKEGFRVIKENAGDFYGIQ